MSNLIHRTCPIGDAFFSPCMKYRYLLTRIIDTTCQYKAQLSFICLNPSTATESENDPTVRRLIGYAKRGMFSELAVLNLFALRSTDPKALYSAEDPVGPDNDKIITEIAATSDVVVAGWGNHGAYLGRSVDVRVLLGMRTLWCFGRTIKGEPKHPLYLRNDAELVAMTTSLGDF